MFDGAGLQEREDKAWAEFKTPVDETLLLEFCRDTERLLRINPYLVFEKWEKTAARRYRMEVVNHSQIPAFKIATDLEVYTHPTGVEIHYHQGLKSCTRFSIEAIPEGSRLIITEVFEGVAEAERLTRLHEADKSLTKWAEEIQVYLVHWKRWAWFAPWRYYKQHIWQPLTPAGRRVTYMLLWISVVEIALVGLGAAIYFVEYG